MWTGYKTQNQRREYSHVRAGGSVCREGSLGMAASTDDLDERKEMDGMKKPKNTGLSGPE